MTREILLRTSADTRRVPWRNGRGVTEELVIWPDRSSLERGDFDWRISRARVDEDGPFSIFAGFERILVALDGAGLVLSHGSDAPRSRLRPLEPYRFEGEWSTRAELVAGPVADFNVFARRGVVRAEVEIARLGARRTREPVGPGHAYLYVSHGAATVRVPREDEPFELATGDGVWARELDGEEELEIVGGTPTTVLAIVRVQAADRGDGAATRPVFFR